MLTDSTFYDAREAMKNNFEKCQTGCDFVRRIGYKSRTGTILIPNALQLRIYSRAAASNAAYTNADEIYFASSH